MVISEASDRVVVVAAGFAWEEYLRCSAYVCQPNRSIQDSVRMAFYTDNKIYHLVPKILGTVEAISRDEIETRTNLSDLHRAWLRALEKRMIPARNEEWGKNQLKVVFLTLPASPDTLILPNDIQNDLTRGEGRRTAFTQGQRYVSLARLVKGPKSTSELV